MKRYKALILALAAVGIVVAGSQVGMAQDKKKQVETRQAFMKKMGANSKAISDYGKGIGDKAKASAAIDELIASTPKIAPLFVSGTSSAEFPNFSYAKPTIWSDKAGFAQSIATLTDLETKLAPVVKTGTPQQVARAMATFGRQGCGGCHTPYREPMPEDQ
jgi:cytochrome c556